MPTVAVPEGDLPESSRRVFEALADLAAEVPIDRWNSVDTEPSAVVDTIDNN